MKKSFKFVIIAFIGLCLVCGLGHLSVAKAESGWDSDYDSGGSWDSDSSWDSGGSWDYDSSSGSYSVSGDFSVIVFIIVIIILSIVITYANNKTDKSRNIKNPNKSNISNNLYRELTDDEMHKIDPDINKQELYQQCFNLYKDIQIAWMNFDFDGLKKYTTDELYHMYESQLKVLKAKHQQNIMSDIEFVSAKVIDITVENGVEKVKLYLNTITRDYVINDKKEVVRGNDKIRNSMEYIITLNRNMEKKNITNCPSCGAKIDIVSGGKCPYCDSVIVNNNNEFVMSKKECIGQRRV